LGYQSLNLNTSGTNNTAIGAGALSLSTTGINNTALGQGAGVSVGTLNNTLALGAGATVGTDNSIQLGNANIVRVNTAGAIQAGSIQNTPIGSISPQTGSFTSLKTTGTNASQVVLTDANNLLSSAPSLPVNLGGTGVSSIPANSVLIGNGIGNLTFVTPNTNGQVLTWNGNNWAATVPTALTTGILGGSTANGLTVSNNVISLSPADATNPGIITTGAQTFAGAKTFASIINSGNLTVNSLTASKVVFTDASKNLNSAGIVGVDQGGTGLNSILLNGVMVGNGTNSISTVTATTNGQVLTWNGSNWTAIMPTAVSAGTLGTSTANGLSVSNNVISLSPADATNPGIITTGAQTFTGAKTFASIINSGNLSVGATYLMQH